MELYGHVDVVWHYAYFHYAYVVAVGYLVKYVSEKLCRIRLGKDFVSVFGAPFEMVDVVPDAMAKANEFTHKDNLRFYLF
jgi:hypothetical protein